MAFFFNHKNFFQTSRKLAHTGSLKRPAHANLIKTQTNIACDFFVDAQIIQRLTRIEIRFTGAEDAKARTRAIPNDAIQSVGACIGQGGVPLVIDQTCFLIKHCIRPANIQPAGRHLEIFRQHDLYAIGVDIDSGAGLHHIGHAFHRHPQAGVTTHGPAVQTVIQIFLHGGWVQHRNAAGFEDMFALVCVGGRLGCMVITCQHQHATMLGAARAIGVLEHIAAAINARAFAVPHREHTVVFRAREQIDLLRAPDAGGGQVFIDTWLEAHMVRLEIFLRFGGSLVDAAQWGATIATDETCGIQTRLQVALPLQHR